MDKALVSFESALEESDGNPDAVCLLAQVLWADGSEESREKARMALFDVIENRPDHVRSVLLLGVIALLDKDDESLEAVISELQAFRTSDKILDTEQAQVGELLRAIATVGADSSGDAAATQAQTDIMLHPHLPHGWANLAEVDEAKFPAQMALKVALKAIPPRGMLDAEDLATAYAGTGTAADAQTAIFVAPWAKQGWNALVDAVSGH
jgi:superkiller protein 3